MLHLNLTKEEREILVQILEEYLSDLRMEIAHTDHVSYREPLKVKKEACEKILDGIQEAREAA
jgi:hypothetical protein